MLHKAMTVLLEYIMYDYDYDLMRVKAQPVYPNNTNLYKNKF